MKRRNLPPVSGNFIVDVMLYLMGQIKYYSNVEIKLENEITHQFYGKEPKETLGRNQQDLCDTQKIAN